MKTIYQQGKTLGIFLLLLFSYINAKPQNDNDIHQQSVYFSLISLNFNEAKRIIYENYLTSSNDSKKIIGFVLLSRYYDLLKDDVEQLKSLNTAKLLAEKTGSEIDQAYVELGFCFIYLKAKNYNQYVKSFNYTASVLNKTTDNYSLLTILYVHKSRSGQSIRDRTNSKDEYLLANQYAIKSRVPYYVFLTYNNLGSYYIHEYKTQKIDLYLDTAKYYLNIANKIIPHIKNATLTDLAKIMNFVNRGAELTEGKKNIDSAIFFQNEALKILKNNPKFVDYEYVAYLNIGFAYEIKNDIKNAKSNYFKAITKLNINNKNDVNHSQLLRNLANTYGKEGEFKKAFESLDSSYTIFQEINSIKNEKNLKLVESLYENQLKEQNIYQLNERTQLLNKQNILFLIILFISILLILVLTYIILLNNKVSRQKSELLQKEKIRLVNESTILKLQNEKIQRDALAISLKLDNKNSVLKSLNDDLQNNKLTSIEKILKEDKHNDENYKQIQNIYENIHPKLFQKLTELSKQKLTNLDLKYAAFIYLNMDNHEISNILKIDINTVRVTKYRLKIKLGLSKNDDLSDFIQQLLFDIPK